MRFSLLITFAWTIALSASAAESIPANGGDIEVTPLGHASVQLEHAGTVIQIDPFGQADMARAKSADLVLITDIHPDHLDTAALAKVRKPGVTVVLPAAAAAQVASPTVTLANGESRTVAGISIEAVPMYNVQRGPKPGELFHPKGRGNGYVLTIGGKRLYVAGDTECTPEMKALENIDVAFIPMNLPYTMPPSEAAACVKAFQPKVAYPYHYRGQDPQEFAAALKGSSTEVRILPGWYPSAAGHSPR